MNELTVPMQECTRCGLSFPASVFQSDDTHAWRRRVAAQLCPTCRNAEFASSEKNVWDWASALVKSTAQSVVRMAGKEGVWTYRIDAPLVRALMQLQRFRCAVTQWSLVIPSGQSSLTKGETLDAWGRRTVSSKQADRMPILVRATADGEWVPGNVALVVRAIKPLIGQTSTLAGLAQEFSCLTPPVIPTESALRDLRAEVILQKPNRKNKHDQEES